MNRFNPILASDNLKQSFIDYIATSFDIADPYYAQKLREELEQDGFVAKGPYLDVSGSFKAGKSLTELMDEGVASKLFSQLEPIDEKDREIKLERPLYLHQEQALRKANEGNNLVVTTGTGSGKTECFLIPIVNALLREQEQGTLADSGVRAIIIYPMNALANDQIKRMRNLLRNYPDITFGLYNGNTKHTQKEALAEYRKIHAKDDNFTKEPLENELISRETMQQTPPHILITNYSMLEYMLLRPKDDKVFSSAKLRYIVLDEAHIYKGTTGMETSMLMRRLRARLKVTDQVQYILTSATLGGKEANKSIVEFGQQLCGLNFKEENIIRSVDASPVIEERNIYPVAFFGDIANGLLSVKGAFTKYGIPDFAPNGNDDEKLYNFLLHSDLYYRFREATRTPKTISAIHCDLGISKQELIDFVAVCTRAEKGNANLIKARYHFFVRALEGAYITLNEPRQLYLRRQEHSKEGQRVFEISVCQDCGRIAIVGKDENGFFQQVARKTERDPKECDFYLLWDSSISGEISSDDEDEVAGTDQAENLGKDDFVICPQCGRIDAKANLHFGPICSCENVKYVSLKRVSRTKEKNIAKCPACGYGTFRSFYLGADAATAVLCTDLFEQLPDREIVTVADVAQPEARPLSGPFAKIAFRPKEPETKKKEKQFLCFSDSRSEAAFFANYLEKSYEEFLRRRGIWHVAKEMQAHGEYSLSVPAFVDRLARVFEKEQSFRLWSPDGIRDADSLSETNRHNAWKALLNELFNGRRATSLSSMGLISFEYTRNDPCDNYDLPTFFEGTYNLSNTEARSLLELIILDACYTGALNAGEGMTLNDEEREYIFFTPQEKHLILCKSSETVGRANLMGWAARARENGKNAYYPSTRLQRLCIATGMSEDDANQFLKDYWENVFGQEKNAEYALNICDFRIRLNADPAVHTYRCRKCGRITVHNVKNRCAIMRCDGQLEEIKDPQTYFNVNHYMKLYSSDKMQPLQVKEHTAQLSRNRQTQYQQAFVDGKINALSCSTTFEMGVDVGGLETVCMRDIPPSPSNYVQRAGRAGRSSHSAAFVMTYAKLSSHDFTYYENPESIISGKISAPVFSLQNKKVIYRHIFAVALSEFFAKYPEVYNRDNATVFLNGDGFEKLKDFLASPTKRLISLLKKSVPLDMHQPMGIHDNSWVDELIGENGILSSAVERYKRELAELEKAWKQSQRTNPERSSGLYRELKQLRCADDDGYSRSLIDFLARNNILPKYGFPVDTVELQIAGKRNGNSNEDLTLARDLQMAIAEYAPGSEVIADGKLYKSRYIRMESVQKRTAAYGYYAKCKTCDEYNFTRNLQVRTTGQECISCGTKIPGKSWIKTIEPRLGFITDKADAKEAPMARPERDYKTEDYYIGDQDHDIIKRKVFSFDGAEVELQSTANDSLVVIGSAQHRVCPICGWTSDANGVLKNKHNTSRGYPCKYEGAGDSLYLSHVFKTDVVKLTFFTSDAADYKTMLSVMYALLEGLSRELEIERTDLKGCLHQQSWSGSSKLLFSIIIYDAVAGGAGHVRRLVTDDGAAFARVLKAAYSVVHNCSCEPSCYHCLRNYYNQKVHDHLDRHVAASFLSNWLGKYTPVELQETEKEIFTDVSSHTAQPIAIQGDTYANDYSSWKEVFSVSGFDVAIGQAWDAAGISLEALILPDVHVDDVYVEPCFAWEKQRILIVDALDADVQNILNNSDWLLMDIHTSPEELSIKLKERS